MSTEKRDYVPPFDAETDYEVPESKDTPIARWLIWTYILLPIWGVIAMYVYINGSLGWFDRGYWHQLQIAANTTFPSDNIDEKTSEN